MTRLLALFPIAAAGLAALLGWAAPAHALTEAETRAFVDELVGFYAQRPGMAGGLLVATEPTITQEGDGFAVLLQEMEWVLLGERIGLGDIAMHVRTEQGERLSLDIALPARVTLIHPSGKTGEALFGERHFTGVWDPSIFAFATMDIAIDSIEVHAGGEMPLRTGRLTLDRDSTQTNDTRWNSATTLHVDGVSVGPDTGPTLARVEAFTARSQLESVDLASYGAMVQALQFDPLSMWPQAGMSEEALNTAADFYEHIAMGRIDSSFAAVGLRVSDSELGAIAGFAIGQVLFESGWSDMVEGRGTLGTRVALGDVELGGLVSDSTAPLMPRAFDLDMEIINVPMAQVLRTVSSVVAQTSEAPGAGAPLAPLVMLGEFQQLLGAAGVILRVRHASLVAPAALAEMQAEARVNAASPYGAIGELTLELEGLDRAIEIMRADPENTDVAGAIGMLMLLQGLGEPVTADGGPSRLRYNFAVGSDGNVLLNGADLSPLLDLMQQP